jgi:hypothetical protein
MAGEQTQRRRASHAAARGKDDGRRDELYAGHCYPRSDRLLRMKETEDLAQKEEENNDAVLELSESWGDDPPQEAESPVPDILSSPETAPSVTPSRKNELLLQARADRIAWIQRVPLPYQTCKTFPLASTDDPWSQDDCLALLRDSSAVQSLPSIPNVLSSLYGMEESTPAHVATRIQALVCFAQCFL